jgi:uncharacterized protein
MKIILSPAKTFSKLKHPYMTLPLFDYEANLFVKKLQKRSIKQLMDMMRVSEKIAESVYHDYQIFGHDRYAAIYLYDGQAFKGLNVAHMSLKTKQRMYENLFILSGLYGLLRPLDGISKYRLEMQDKNLGNLYTFWKPKLNAYLNEFLGGDLLINLASIEYSQVITYAPMITLDFRQMKDGKIQSMSMYTKKARGMMARLLLEKEIKDPHEITNLTFDGYTYQKGLSDSTTMIFMKAL